MLRQPHINRFYHQFLENQRTANFIASVSQSYTIPTLHRLAIGGDRITRRSAVLALSFLGAEESFHVVGCALKDDDRAVRVLANDGIRGIWSRSHGSKAEKEINVVSRLLVSSRFDESLLRADRIVAEFPDFAEAWSKRAIALFELDRTYDAIADCQRVLELNPFHFPAATGLAHCFMDLDNPSEAIRYFQYALSISPDLEYVRNQIDVLQRSRDY